MTDLPPRLFDLGESVWADVGGLTHHGTIWGHEDGRALGKHGRSWAGWAYHVELHGVDGEELGSKIVGEGDLRKIHEGHEHAT